MNTSHTKQFGFSPVIIVIIVLGLVSVGFMGLKVAQRNSEVSNSKNADTMPAVAPPQISSDTTTTSSKQSQADSQDTLSAPVKVATKDASQYFIYGAPAGHNNKQIKKILITMHGTEGSAERDYEVWKPFIVDTDYALASLNWWDGAGDATTDYSTPQTINGYIHDFLTANDYTAKDTIVFEGFSRGSANSFPIVAHDRTSGSPMIDVAISSSGGAQDPYFKMTTSSIRVPANVFSGVDWIMACGGKDPNPDRDGCKAMENSKQFVEAKGATVLGILSDPNGIHGALTTSNLNLTKTMFELIDQEY